MDDHGYTSEPEDAADAPEWSTSREERTFGLVRDLLMEMRERGCGIYLMPVREGKRVGPYLSEESYPVDGWVVGQFGVDGGHDLAVGPWLDQVVEAACAAAR